MLPPPFPVTQETAPLCWAAALSAWLLGTPGRRGLTVEEIVSRFKDCLLPDSGGLLDPSKFVQIAEAPAVRMAWQPLAGTDLTEGMVDYITSDLCFGGYLYALSMPQVNDDGLPLAHARVIYGSWLGYAWAMDAMTGNADFRWPYADIRNYRLLIGVRSEIIPEWSRGWQRPS